MKQIRGEKCEKIPGVSLLAGKIQGFRFGGPEEVDDMGGGRESHRLTMTGGPGGLKNKSLGPIVQNVAFGGKKRQDGVSRKI